MKRFELLTCPLSGIQLIDASAGTGKTYTIAGLVVRLVAEKGLALPNILVVTYTTAATEDLRTRVRAALRTALAAFTDGRSDDSYLQGLLATVDGDLARSRLDNALRDFDEAGIFTIHGFCQRMLRENSLESGVLFDTELVNDLDDLQQEICEDFWRSHFYTAPPLFTGYVRQRYTPASLLGILKDYVAGEGVAIIPEPSEYDPEQVVVAEGAVGSAFARLRSRWPAVRGEVERILTTDAGLSRTSYRLASIPAWLRELDVILQVEEVPGELFKGFEKFTSATLAKGMKKNCSPPDHFFFSECQDFFDRHQEMNARFAAAVGALRIRLFHYLQEELAIRKERRNVFAFDDLLTRLRQGLEGANGAALARAIGNKYPAALIDEFQDTDPVQYRIFTRIYGGEGGKLLFLIGDPKQAIYSFRGADIFAYLQAVREAGQRFTLATNWRSTPPLIQAVNTIFQQGRNSFVFKEIEFAPVRAAEREARERLVVDELSAAPLQLWLLHRERADKLLTKAEAGEQILAAMAAEVSRLLTLAGQGRANLGARPLAPRDIAILVRTNREAGQVQEALRSRGVFSVLHATASVFSTQEAVELERLLLAFLTPGSDRAIKAALCTTILGLNGNDLAKLAEDESGWEEWLVRCQGYHEQWLQFGFMRMFQTFLAGEGVRRRLLAAADGERRLTNLLHVGELLHRQEVTRKLGMRGVVEFLATRLAAGEDRSEEHQLRLESDGDRVRIVTMHKAKGLEYPLVFCPFSWQGSRLEKKKEFAFHAEDSAQLTLELGSPAMAEHRQRAYLEELAENLRLLYVALTRAVHRCYLVWGGIKGAESSPLAYLLHPFPGGAGLAVGEARLAIAERFVKLSDEEIATDLHQLMAAAGGSIALTSIAAAGAGKVELAVASLPELAAREVAVGQGRRPWRISSFSYLIHGQPRVAELPDHDGAPAGRAEVEEVAILPAAGEQKTIFRFPQGAAAGTFMHEILEVVDFQAPAAAIAGLVGEKLQAHGYDPSWQPAVVGMVEQVRQTPLQPGLRLQAVTPEQRLNELEFYFPAAPVDGSRLGALFARHGGNRWVRGFGETVRQLSFPQVEGFMKGFIDLVFAAEGRYYLVDWKSNHLGERLADYLPERLGPAMAAELYILQYHLYTLALHRYLARRLPEYRYEEHFGGVFYLFLRGVAAETGGESGIYRDRPPLALVEGLDQLLTSQMATSCLGGVGR